MSAAKVLEATGTTTIPLAEIVSNTAQSRGMGVLTQLQILGYGLFEKTTVDEGKEPIWSMLFSEKPEEQKEAVTLITENEPEIVKLAAGRKKQQLQPIGVVKVDGGYDVIFGMRRCLADAFNMANSGEPTEIEAKIFEGKATGAELLLMALEENADREDESPIDKALTYQKLMKDYGFSAEEVGKRINKSGQHVREYQKLIHKSMEDKRLAIHTGTMTIEQALKLFAARKEGEDSSPREAANGNRRRLPGTKGILKILTAKRKPKKLSEKEWEWYTNPVFRQGLCFFTGLKYKEFTEEPEEEAPKKKKGKASAESNGEAPKTKKILKVKRERAKLLLISLGKTNARTWEDKTLKEKLEGIVNIVEEGQKAENESLQKLLDRLTEGYKEGLVVEIVDDKEKK